MELEVTHGHQPEQVDRLYELETICFEPKFRWGKDELVSSLRDDDIWVGVYDGQVIGYVLIHLNKYSGHVISLNVDPTYRRKGFAKALMGAAEAYCMEREVKKLELEVHTDNPAQLLYFNLGYRPSGFDKDYYGKGSHALVMTKEFKR